MDDLLKRLRLVETGDGFGDHLEHWYRNPDGVEAAGEIERLRKIVSGYNDGISADTESNRSCAQSDEKRGVADTDRAMLTDAEREAIEWYASFPDGIHRATLRNLLERLK